VHAAPPTSPKKCLRTSPKKCKNCLDEQSADKFTRVRRATLGLQLSQTPASNVKAFFVSSNDAQLPVFPRPLREVSSATQDENSKQLSLANTELCRFNPRPRKETDFDF
jgi:hypothetical protein